MQLATRHRRRLLLAVLGAAAAAFVARDATPQPRRSPTPPPFEESIEVVETSVIATPPAGLRRMGVRDWEVREDGAARRVDRVDAIGDEPWQLVLWIDGPLCAQAALPRTLLALAHQAEALTRRGSVRIVAAAPEPRTVLAATRDAAAVVDALAALSTQTLCSGEPDGLFWQARGMPRAAAPNAALATAEKAATALAELRRLVERRTALLADASPPCEAEACAVLLVSHGYPLDADLRLPPELRPADARAHAAALAATTEGLARRLAVARWLVVALPFLPPPPPGEESEADSPLPKEARPGPEPFPDMGDLAPPGAPAPVRRLPKIAPPPAATDVYILPELAPLRTLADSTAGDVLRVPEQLPALFDSFAQRRRLWFRTTPFAPGESRRLEVHVRGRQAEAPAWIGRPR
jgi:hypothetical protein